METALPGRTPWRSPLGSAWLLPAIALVVDVWAMSFLLPRGPVRDELVFFPAARAFASAGVFPSLEFWRSYPAPQTPLSLYLAGRVLALVPSLLLLRFGNSLLMFAALLRFSRFAARNFGTNARLGIALVALNPYFHLVATHFYTDALYFWLAVQVTTRASSRSTWLPLALLPLVRQFGIIYALGEALYALGQRRFRAAALALGALLPLLALFALWQGVLPDTPRARVQSSVHSAYGWFFPYVVSYHVAALGFYLAPIAWRIERTRRFYWFGLAFAIGYALAPAHANFSAQLADTGITTLGYFHRATLSLGPNAAQIALCVFAFIGGGLLGEAWSAPSAPAYIVSLFVVFSLFGFQAWDKYLLDILPTALIALLAPAAAPTSAPMPTENRLRRASPA